MIVPVGEDTDQGSEVGEPQTWAVNLCKSV